MRSMRLFLSLAFSALMLLEGYGFTVETDKQGLLEFKSRVSENGRVPFLMESLKPFMQLGWGYMWPQTQESYKFGPHRIATGWGKLPASLGNLTSLTELVIGDNNIEGGIPDDIARLTQMVTLESSRNNFSGVLPPAIYNLSSLELLYMFDNGFSGNLREDFGSLLPNLKFLYLRDNNLTGPIPATLPNISTLQRLDLQFNNLIGSIPRSFGKHGNCNT
ncbi:unnamed protein product [Microthlaspi erraticum]|uniref:Leucine-rich repeat-containing N-terminal plant-type domain-containing protein n=1 Tax=Microthlaspi erraticum TaxID=1685480 RepID=A0A6D2J7R8_9BRAS|nr:unnamed protein product [Microthlaspi erraticum]